jgi:type III restriction enzyme
MQLRTPNKEAVEVLALRMRQWYEQPRDEFFEGVLDVATGVGKTFIIAAALDYYSALGFRNFAVIAPGRTILNKTVTQFSQGQKSLLPFLASTPKVITSENFTTSEVAASLTDNTQVKLYIFTVSSLLRPTSKAGRKTHKFQEGLGGAFYAHLDGLDDLIVFADEHHTYYGVAFGRAIRDLNPLALVGLTGTPDRRTPADQIIYRYPLAAAIAEKYVKTPVIVGRKDSRTDERTQLLDGAALLDLKAQALRTYCEAHGIPVIHPVMLVNCRDIAHARETVDYLTSDQFADGKYGAGGAVLEVHSDKTLEEKEKALTALDAVEEPSSPCRIIVQVGMLKEGWDVKNVYVIASLRSSVSEILTEQTLGRGLRLPFGGYTDMPLLNELDVLAHERYSDLLKKSNLLRETFIDKRTVIEKFINHEGREEVGITTAEVTAPVVFADGDGGAEGAGGASRPQAHDLGVPSEDGVVLQVGAEGGLGPAGSAPASGVPAPGSASGVIFGGVEDRLRDTQPQFMLPLEDVVLHVPVVRTTPVPVEFKLAVVTDLAPFRELGRRLAVSPDAELRRTRLGAALAQDTEGNRQARILPSEALQRVNAVQIVDDPDEALALVVQGVMADPLITKRQGEPQQVQRLLTAVLEGAGDKAGVLLSSYRPSVINGILRVIRGEKAKLGTAMQTLDEVRLAEFKPVRTQRPNPNPDRRTGKAKRGEPYIGWSKGLYEQAWFDSNPEREMANILDDTGDIKVWVRLHDNDLPILWSGAERT